jgi:outer membrane receptor protein involved in Fe transport
MKKKNLIGRRAFVLLAAIFFAIGWSVMKADTKGKLTGQVLDSKKAPVIGANVVMVGTTAGASTDIDGNYTILNIPPGTYQLRISVIGFSPQTINGVRISSGQTTTINASLLDEAVAMGEVVIVAERPMVDVRQTSAVSILGKDQIGQLPVQDLSDIVNLQAGVVDGHFRGGRLGEVQYQVDGVSVNNPYDNSSSVKLDRSVLQEVQVISGTFDAEYGQAMSGVVNAILKSGSEDHFEWNAEMYGGDYVSPGSTARFPHIDKLNPLAIHNYQLSLDGPTGLDKTTFLVGVRRYGNEGYLYGTRLFQPGDSADFQNYVLRGSGDGALVPMASSDEWSGQMKIENRSLKDVHLSYQAIGSIVNAQRYQNAFVLLPDGQKKQKSVSFSHGIDFTHTINSTLFYLISVRQNYYRYTDFVYEDVYDARYVQYGRPRGDKNYALGAYVQGVDLDRFKQETSSYILKVSVTNQAAQHHLLKLGAEMQYSTLTFGPPGSLVASTVNGVQVLVPIVDSYEYPGLRTYRPVSFAAYAQDLIEFKDFLVRGGIRAEYFDARALLPSDLQNPANAISGTGLPASEQVSTSRKLVVAPRLGISYPVVEQGSVFFSYGHFYQMPGLGQLFSNSDYRVLKDLQAGAVSYGVMGNPNLKPEFTTQYEFGFKTQIPNLFGFDLSMYYKDIRNLLGVEFVQTYTAAEYARLTNIDFGDVSGFTASVDFRGGTLLSASLDYTYQIAMGNSSDPRETATRAAAGEDARPRQVPLGWDQQHTLNATITLSQQGNFNITSVVRLGSGQPYTPTVLSRLGANLETNSSRKSNYMVVDLRAEKSFPLFGVGASVFLRMFNVFDARAVNGFIFSDTGSPDYTLNVAGNASVLQDPSRYYAPRRIELGISLNGSSR